jgi:hypothetical protein
MGLPIYWLLSASQHLEMHLMITEENKEHKFQILESGEVLLVEWAFALNELAFSSKEGLANFRELETLAASHWFKGTVGELPKTKTAYDAAVKFRDIANEKGVIRGEDFKLKEVEGGTILGTFLSNSCAYKKCCAERKYAGKKFLCLRATPFVTAVNIMTDKNYVGELIPEKTEPGEICLVKGIQKERNFKIGLSYKLGSGTVKINEKDLAGIGISIIDTVEILPNRKELTDKKLIAMSYSDRKYPAGMILISVIDAKKLGLTEKDTVSVNKAAPGAQPNIVSEFTINKESVAKTTTPKIMPIAEQTGGHTNER